MPDTLLVTVNNTEVAVPNDFGATPREFLDTLGGWGDQQYDVYRDSMGAKLDEDDRCGEPMVVSEGDAFVVVPRYVDDGG